MKQLLYLFIALLMGMYHLYAQDVANGQCPTTITVRHNAGDFLSAASTDISYNVVKITATATPTCWITQNLGASAMPATSADYGATTSGWSYQLKHKQGYVNGIFSSASLITTLWTTTGDAWPADMDPCTLTFGYAWRLPTTTEYADAFAVPWTTGIKLNSAPPYVYNGTAWIRAANPAGEAYTAGYWARDINVTARELNAFMVGPHGNADTGIQNISNNRGCTALLSVRCVAPIGK